VENVENDHEHKKHMEDEREHLCFLRWKMKLRMGQDDRWEKTMRQTLKL
jgi:hypothetical protein